MHYASLMHMHASLTGLLLSPNYHHATHSVYACSRHLRDIFEHFQFGSSFARAAAAAIFSYTHITFVNCMANIIHFRNILIEKCCIVLSGVGRPMIIKTLWWAYKLHLSLVLEYPYVVTSRNDDDDWTGALCLVGARSAHIIAQRVSSTEFGAAVFGMFITCYVQLLW